MDSRQNTNKLDEVPNQSSHLKVGSKIITDDHKLNASKRPSQATEHMLPESALLRKEGDHSPSGNHNVLKIDTNEL